MSFEIVLLAAAAVVLAVVGIALQRAIDKLRAVHAADLDHLQAVLAAADTLVVRELGESRGADEPLAPRLAPLLDRLADEAAAQGLPIERRELRGHLARALVARHLALPREVEEAMREVA